MPASRSPSQMLPDRCLGVRVEDQLDGVDHQPARFVTQPRVERRRRSSPRNRPRDSAPAPAGSTARTGASLLQRVAVAHLGSTRFAPATPR